MSMQWLRDAIPTVCCPSPDDDIRAPPPPQLELDASELNLVTSAGTAALATHCTNLNMYVHVDESGRAVTVLL